MRRLTPYRKSLEACTIVCNLRVYPSIRIGFKAAREMPMPGTDDDEIRAVARSYVEGMIGADESALRSAFHPSASIVGNYHDAVEWLSVDGFIAEVLAVGASAFSEDSWEFVSLDITDDAAVAKTTCTYAGAQFTDYLSLLKIEGRWKIVAKLYHLHG